MQPIDRVDELFEADTLHGVDVQGLMKALESFIAKGLPPVHVIQDGTFTDSGEDVYGMFDPSKGVQCIEMNGALIARLEAVAN